MNNICSSKIDTLHKIKKIDNTGTYKIQEIKDSIFIKNFSPYIGENGNWFEFDVNKGTYIDTGTRAKGQDGNKGDKGDKPVKGVDYFTNEEIAEIETKIINSIPTPPTKISELTNDSGFINKETDPTVPEWAKAEVKPTYTANEVGAIAKGANISELKNDIGYLTAHQDISGKVDKVNGKNLSTNDYTNEDKSKVENIPENPKYTDTIYDDSAVLNKIGELQSKDTFDTLNISDTLQIGNVTITKDIATALVNTTKKFECILDATVEEDCKTIAITQFPDGSPIKIRDIAFNAYILQSDVTGSFGLELKYNNNIITHCVATGMSTTANIYSAGYLVNVNGLWLQGGMNASSDATWRIEYIRSRPKLTFTIDAPYIDSVTVRQLNSGTIKAGSKIQVYAVKMEE